MPIIERSALVPYRAEDMYAIVVDVSAYPDYLPWCAGAAVQSQTHDEQRASVTINAVVSQPAFHTKNRLHPGESILMELEDGPFTHLRGEWGFKALGDMGCKITLVVDFEFSSPIIRNTLSPGFTRVCDSLVDAFIQRANDTLGNVQGSKT